MQTYNSAWCETCSHITGRHWLQVFKNGMLKKISGPKEEEEEEEEEEEVRRYMRKLHEEELHGLHSTPNSTWVIK